MAKDCLYNVYDRVMLLYDHHYIMNLAKPGDTGIIHESYPVKNGRSHYAVYFSDKNHAIYIKEEDLVRI